MKYILSFFILCLVFLMGCQTHIETMELLDEKISAINVSESNGLGGMNEDIIMSFTDEESMKGFKKAITSAQKQSGKVDISKPDYDVMVKYGEGQPTHGIHLWLGKENEKSMFMYIGDNEVYLTSVKDTGK